MPLYKTLEEALESLDFLRYGQRHGMKRKSLENTLTRISGRILAVLLNRSYAHTHEHLNFLPTSLKGADMSFYETALALDLRCKLAPVIKAEFAYEDESQYRILNKFTELLDFDFDPEEYDEDVGDSMQEGKVTWVNPPIKKTKGSKTNNEMEKFEEIQMAYLAVSQGFLRI